MDNEDIVIDGWDVSISQMPDYYKAREIWLDSNEMLWSYAKDNKLLTFFHVKDGTGYNDAINIRRSATHLNLPPALNDSEYFSPNNRFCVCSCWNNRMDLFGFIMYRCIDNVIYLLDIVFNEHWKQIEEIKHMDVEYNCMKSFCKFINDIEYKCIWRKALYLHNNTRVAQKPSVTKHSYESYRVQRQRVGSSSMKICDFAKIENE